MNPTRKPPSVTAWLVLPAALLLWPALSQAQTYQVAATVNTIASSTFPGPREDVQNADDLNLLNNPQALALNALDEVATVSTGGASSARFLGSIGLLKAYASASFGYCCDLQGRLLLAGYATGTAQGSFYDTVLVSGAGLAVGTPVSYRIDFSIDGTTSQPLFEIGGALSVYGIADVRLRDMSSGSEARLSWDVSRQATGLYSLTLATEVGHTLDISGMLAVGAYVTSNATLGRSAESDFYHSAVYTLAPSVAGLNTLGASGHDFLAPVPEPASWLLMACGGLALALRRRAASQDRP